MNWDCNNCDYTSDEFNKVWNHCKGASHTMYVTKKGIKIMMLQACDQSKKDFELSQPKRILDKKNDLIYHEKTLDKFLRNGWSDVKCIRALIQRTQIELCILQRDFEDYLQTTKQTVQKEF